MEPEDVKLSTAGECIALVEFIYDKVPWRKVIPFVSLYSFFLYALLHSPKIDSSNGFDVVFAFFGAFVTAGFFFAIGYLICLLLKNAWRTLTPILAADYRKYRLKQQRRELDRIDDHLLK